MPKVFFFFFALQDKLFTNVLDRITTQNCPSYLLALGLVTLVFTK